MRSLRISLFCLLFVFIQLSMHAFFFLEGIAYTKIPGVDDAVEVSNEMEYIGDIVIPATIVFGSRTYNVVRIGDNAFENQSKVTSVQLPNTIQSIGENAFRSCSNLSAIEIPKSVVEIGNNVFENCINLKNMTINNSPQALKLGQNVFLNCRISNLFLGRDMVGTSNFSNMVSLVNVTCGTDVTTISNYMFADCTHLGSIVLPYTVKYIGESAFKNCYYLSYIGMGDVEEIGGGAFEQCVRLNQVTIPSTTTKIEGKAFYGCSGLTNLKFVGGSSKINISSNAFEHCSLDTLYFARNLSSIQEKSPFENKNITHLILGEQLEDLLFRTFRNCNKISSVIFPKSIKAIRGEVFAGCSKLNDITLLSTTPPLSFEESFDERILKEATLTVPDGTYADYKTAQGWRSFANIKEKSIRHRLMIDLSKGGAASFNNTQITNGNSKTFEVKENSSFTIKIEPAAGFSIDKIFLNDQDKSSFYNSTTGLVLENLTTDVHLLITFKEITSHLMVASSDVNGGILYFNGSYAGTSINTNLKQGAKVTLQYAVSADYKLTGIFLNNHNILNQAEENQIVLVMDTDKSLFFQYEKKKVNYELQLSQAEQGCIKFPVEENETLDVYIEANKGWKINTITFNGADVTSQLDDESHYKTPAITDNSQLNITFELETPSAIQELSTNKISIRGYNGNIVVEGAKQGDEIKVYTVDGAIIASQISNGSNIQINVEENQVYLVKIGQRTFKMCL